MKRLYEKNQLALSLVWVGVYVVAFSLADGASGIFGVEKLLTAPVALLMIMALLRFLKTCHIMKECGLAKVGIRWKQYGYFLPLLILMSTNFWGGVELNTSANETVLFVVSMIAVGVLEEIIFRGLLFRALCKSGIRFAVIVSSLSFGLGHIVNLINGAQLLPTLLQIVYATAVGFLFTILYLKSGSLIPCIVTHCAVNSFSAFSADRSMTLDVAAAVIITVISIAYGLWILYKNPENKVEGI